MTDYDLAQLSGASIVDIGGSASPYHVVGKVSAAVLCRRIRSKFKEDFGNLASVQQNYGAMSIGPSMRSILGVFGVFVFVLPGSPILNAPGLICNKKLLKQRYYSNVRILNYST